jgi:excisionase family DNA binding protein
VAVREDPLLTLPEVAEYLRIPLSTLYQLRHQGKAPRGYRVGRRVIVARSELEAWLRAQADPQPRPAG